MNIYDLLVGLILVIATWRGFSKGIILQLSGIVGILAGAWLAGKFARELSRLLDIESQSEILVYIAFVIIVMIGVIVLLRGLNRVLTLGGLSLPIKILGVFTSLLKYVLVLALIQSLVFRLLERGEGVEGLDFEQDIRSSHSYVILNNVSEIAFPYLVDLAEMVYTPVEESVE
ncbi:MAG: CvpA family protein [Rikenellaceae bacterium]